MQQSKNHLQLLNDIYEVIPIFTCHWKAHNTGRAPYCAELIKTISRLHGSRHDLLLTHIIDSKDAPVVSLIVAVGMLLKKLDLHKRNLLIFHYAGHATANSTSNDLILTELDQANQLGNKLGENQTMSFTLIKDVLISLSPKNPNIDVLMLMDCFYATAAGRVLPRQSGRVELVGATTPTDVANQNQDGRTFTLVV